MYQKSRCCCYAWRAKQHHLGWRQHLDRFCHFKKNQSLSKHSKLFPKIKNKSKRRKQHCSKGIWVKAKEWETKHKCKSQNERNEIDLMWWTDGAGWRFIAQASSLLNLILWLWHGHFAPCICLFFWNVARLWVKIPVVNTAIPTTLHEPHSCGCSMDVTPCYAYNLKNIKNIQKNLHNDCETVLHMQVSSLS